MNLWKNFSGHLITILYHKSLVRHYCFKAGLYKQGLIHDWSKYSPVEFISGVRYFQNGKRSPNFGEKKSHGYSSAWLHHKGRNRHHFEYWIDMTLDTSQGLQGMPMPTRYVLEMFCDRIAASRNYNRDTYDDTFPLAYYEKNKTHYTIHRDAASMLELLLHMLAEEGEKKTFTYIRRKINWRNSPKW